MKQFWNKHKVFILGGLSAAVMAANELLSKGTPSNKVLAYAAFIAVLSYLSRNLRGQWGTIAGIILTSAATVWEQTATGLVTWRQILLQMGLAIIATLVGPPKGREYEHSPTIEHAKAEGLEIKAAKEEHVPPLNKGNLPIE